MSSPLPQVLAKYEALKTSWESRSHSECGKLLDELKLALTPMLLPTEGHDVDQKV
jgi:hypothetical protein